MLKISWRPLVSVVFAALYGCQTTDDLNTVGLARSRAAVSFLWSLILEYELPRQDVKGYLELSRSRVRLFRRSL